MTPHQRRLRELEASRRVQLDLQGLIEAHPGAVPTVAVAEAFERCGSLLPRESSLLHEFEKLAQGLRKRPAAHIGEDAVRRVITNLRQRSDAAARRIEARDARLKQKP